MGFIYIVLSIVSIIALTVVIAKSRELGLKTHKLSSENQTVNKPTV